MFRGMRHGANNIVSASHQIHRAAHAFDKLAGDHPRGDIALLINLEGAQYGQIHMPTTNHGKGLS